MFTENLRQVVARLRHNQESDHFRIHYARANPEEGLGAGSCGVRSSALVVAYLDALERLFTLLATGRHSRTPPRTKNGGKTDVFLIDPRQRHFAPDDPYRLGGNPSPITDEDDGVPYVVLFAHSDTPTSSEEESLAAAAAVHEGTHVFNWSRPQMGTSASRQPWRWFDEGTAVFMESEVFPKNPEWLRYVADWCDHPEVPLDYPRGAWWYASVSFVRYLARRLGREFINAIWEGAENQSPPVEEMQKAGSFALKAERWSGPLETINRVLVDWPRGAPFAEIWSDYCVDSYFLWDSTSRGFEPDVHGRHGERAVAQSFRLAGDKPVSHEGCLDRLACHYYRLFVPPDAHRIHVRITLPGVAGADAPAFGAVLAVVRAGDRRRGACKPLTVARRRRQATLTASLTRLNPTKIDHIVLTVIHGADPLSPRSPILDPTAWQRFELVASVTTGGRGVTPSSRTARPQTTGRAH